MSIIFQTSCFMGNARAGKTLSMVETGYNTLLEIKIEVKRLKDKGKLNDTEKKRLSILDKIEIWSNLTLNKRIFGDYRKIDVTEILEIYDKKEEITNKLIMIDDIFKAVDSRNFMKKENKAFGYFLKEIGKKHNILLYVSHFDTDVEIRLRNLTDVFVLCKKGRFQKIKLPNGNDIDVFIEEKNYYELKTEKELKNMVVYQMYFKKFIDFDNYFVLKRELVDEKYIKAFKYFKYYNTMEVV